MGFRSGRVDHRDVTTGEEAGEIQPALLTLKIEEEGHELQGMQLLLEAGNNT